MIILNQDLERVEQPFACFAVLALGIDIEIVAEVQDVARGLDFAAVDCAAGQEVGSIVDDGLRADDFDGACALTGLPAGCVERAADFDLAARAAVEQDLTFVVRMQGLGLDDARVVDDGAHDIAGALGRHDDVAAVALERAAVEGLGVGEAAVDREVELASRIGRDVEVLGCGECRRAAFICNRARILDRGRVQRDKAAFGLDGAGVDHAGLPASCNLQAEVALALREVTHVFIGHVGRRSDESADVDAAVLAEEHAVRVDDEDVTRCRERAVDDGPAVSYDAVDGDSALAVLVEVDLLVFGDVELLPIESEAVGLLVDDHRLVVRAYDLALTGDNLALLWHSLDTAAVQRHGHDGNGDGSRLRLPAHGLPMFVRFR